MPDHPAREPIDPELRPVTMNDVPRLAGMVRAYYADDALEWVEARQMTALRAIAAGDPLVRGWMVEREGQAVGYVVLTISFSVESGGRDGFVDELFVAPDVRGRGVGRRVLELVDREARALGLERLYLEVEHGNRAIDLYRRAGFVEHQRHLMSKRL